MKFPVSDRLWRYRIVDALCGGIIKTTNNDRNQVIKVYPGKPLATIAHHRAQPDTVQRQQLAKHAAVMTQHHANAQDADPHTLLANGTCSLLPGITQQIGKVSLDRRTGFGQFSIATVTIEAGGRSVNQYCRLAFKSRNQPLQRFGNADTTVKQHLLASLGPASTGDTLAGEVDDRIEVLVIRNVIQ